MKVINSPKAPAPIGPYSQAKIGGGFLFASGQICFNNATGEFENKTIEEEITQVMKNLGYVLEEAGIGFDSIMKCTIFIKDMNDFGRINEIYASYFDKNPPARETVEVSRLPKDVRVEISCIAAI